MKKLKGGALYLAIAISLLVSLLSFFLLIRVWYYHYETFLFIKGNKIDRNLRSAILLVKESPNLINYNTPTVFDLFSEGDSIWVEKKHWGGFCQITATSSQSKQKGKKKTELVGVDIFDLDSVALYLADYEKYLSVCGATNLVGTCYLPLAGIRKTTIEGAGYTGNESPITGNVKQSQPNIPDLDTEFILTNENYLNGKISLNDTLIQIKELLKRDSIGNSFHNSSYIFLSNKPLIIDKKLNGNIRIISSEEIIIRGTAVLNDVILYAPKVKVEAGFGGTLQIFASDTLIIGDNVNLRYPAFCALLCNKPIMPIIKIGAGCSIWGEFILYKSKQMFKNTQIPLLTVGKKTDYNGRILCYGRLELNTDIVGSIYTDLFYLVTKTSIYENQLLNNKIDVSKLSKNYIGSVALGANKGYKTIKVLQ